MIKLLILVLFLHTLVLMNIIFFPYPEFFVNPYLVTEGFKPYQQIMDQHAPGLMFFPINFYSLGMTTPEVARIWLISIVLIIQIMLFTISTKILKSYKKAFFVSLLYLLWQPLFEGSTFWIDTILPIFLLPAFYTTHKIVNGKLNFKTVFLCGLFFGMAIVFKQVILPLAILIIMYLFLNKSDQQKNFDWFWLSKKIKMVLTFLLGLLIPLFFMLLYFLSIGVLKDFWYWTVIFNLTIFAKYGKKFATEFAQVSRVLFVFLASGLGFFSKDTKTFILLALFIIGSLAGAFARFDFVHFQPALPFVVLSTFLGFDSIKGSKNLRWIILIYLGISLWWISIFYRGHISNEVVLYDKNVISISNKVKQLTKSGDKIFILGAPLHLYQMTGTLPAAGIFYVQAPWYFMVAGVKTLEGIKHDQPNIVLLDPNLVFEGSKLIDYASDIYQYVVNNYHIIDQVGSVQIMQRNSP